MIASMPRILGGLLLLLLIAYWLRRRNRGGEPATLQKQPGEHDLWDSMTEHFEELDRELERARHWSEGEVALAIEQYVFKLKHSSEDDADLVRKLAQQPEKTQRQILKVLADPDMQTRLRKEPRGEPALYRACQVLLTQPTKQGRSICTAPAGCNVGSGAHRGVPVACPDLRRARHRRAGTRSG